MANPEELLSNLERAVSEVDKAKKAILMLSRDSEASIVVLYRLALYMLHEEHDLEGAVSLFSKLAACGVDCEARTQARISYALVLWPKQQYDSAIDWLKRVNFEEKNPVYRALVLDYLSTFLREQKVSKPAIAKNDEERIQVLQALVAAEADKKLKSEYQLRLDAALKERETPID